MRRPWARLLLCACALWGAFASSRAATLEVAPVSHELPPGRNSLSMTVANHGDTPVTVQVRGFAWTQDELQEQLEPAEDVVLSPPIFTLAPGKSQTVRAIFPPVQDAGSERTYRMLIDEIPGTEETDVPVRFALRLSVPVFRLAEARRPPRVSYAMHADGQLVARNDGGTRERLREVTLALPGGDRIEPKPPATSYVLTGTKRIWSLDGKGRPLRPGDTVILTAQTDAGRVELPLVVAP